MSISKKLMKNKELRLLRARRHRSTKVILVTTKHFIVETKGGSKSTALVADYKTSCSCLHKLLVYSKELCIPKYRNYTSTTESLLSDNIGH